MAVILSKINFYLPKKAGAHFQYVCNNYAKFQMVCLKTVEEVDYTNYTEKFLI